MTINEQKALTLHNSIYIKKGIKLVSSDLNRFKVLYSDGKVKWDYECNSSAKRIRAVLTV